MMHGILIGLLVFAVCALVAALMRQPGVMLYDWVAARAVKRRAVLREAAARKADEARRGRTATQAG
ncbi:hypothetical protein QEP16_17980 [Achromobacter insolitus]|uniref:hypothetical protein n=1 Tax=Achromobacter insolitus TaxID=217204 RepID=UPI000536B749|nr:hypothetical protein [Achromobacter insolitus]AVG38819.1 hypothetical protein MC81_05250 [Achromobacter insolitus]MDH3065226.1 hypothetical protein [Achromobacter insolitus]QEK93677.1 hypothetical protein E2544_18385 [Achromobacter insolitus]GLK94144.1 hypothetical protein GCM10008164_18810 [Achromobacter xylosoxidans]